MYMYMLRELLPLLQPIAAELPAHWGVVSLSLKKAAAVLHSLFGFRLRFRLLDSFPVRTEGLLSGTVICKFFPL